MEFDTRIAVEERFSLEAEERRWRDMIDTGKKYDVLCARPDSKLETHQLIGGDRVLEGLDNGGLKVYTNDRLDIIDIRERNPDCMYDAWTQDGVLGNLTY